MRSIFLVLTMFISIVTAADVWSLTADSKIYTDPDRKSTPLFHFKSPAEINMIDADYNGFWSKVSYNGITGYSYKINVIKYRVREYELEDAISINTVFSPSFVLSSIGTGFEANLLFDKQDTIKNGGFCIGTIFHKHEYQVIDSIISRRDTSITVKENDYKSGIVYFGANLQAANGLNYEFGVAPELKPTDGDKYFGFGFYSGLNFKPAYKFKCSPSFGVKQFLFINNGEKLPVTALNIGI